MDIPTPSKLSVNALLGELLPPDYLLCARLRGKAQGYFIIHRFEDAEVKEVQLSGGALSSSLLAGFLEGSFGDSSLDINLMVYRLTPVGRRVGERYLARKPLS